MREDLSLGEDLLFNLSYFDAVPETGFGIISKANYIYYNEDGESLSRKYRPDLLENYQTIHEGIRQCLIKWDAWDEKTQGQYYDYVFRNFTLALEN